jgi:hypothetical protein
MTVRLRKARKAAYPRGSSRAIDVMLDMWGDAGALGGPAPTQAVGRFGLRDALAFWNALWTSPAPAGTCTNQLYNGRVCYRFTGVASRDFARQMAIFTSKSGAGAFSEVDTAAPVYRAIVVMRLNQSGSPASDVGFGLYPSTGSSVGNNMTAGGQAGIGLLMWNGALSLLKRPTAGGGLVSTAIALPGLVTVPHKYEFRVYGATVTDEARLEVWINDALVHTDYWAGPKASGNLPQPSAILNGTRFIPSIRCQESGYQNEIFGARFIAGIADGGTL